MEKSNKISYQKIYWLFIFGGLFGLVLEGFWCLIQHGSWENHMIFIWEPLCGIYGYGAAGCYIGAVLLKKLPLIVRFLSFSFIGTTVEFVGGFLLDHGLHMRAWDYSDTFMNISGYVNLKMTILWGILGILFSYLLPLFEKVFDKMRGKVWRVACAGLTVFLVADMVVTSMCLVRWRDRHEGVPADNRIEQVIDDIYPDEAMEKRFCNWYFIDDVSK